MSPIKPQSPSSPGAPWRNSTCYPTRGAVLWGPEPEAVRGFTGPAGNASTQAGRFLGRPAGTRPLLPFSRVPFRSSHDRLFRYEGESNAAISRITPEIHSLLEKLQKNQPRAHGFQPALIEGDRKCVTARGCFDVGSEGRNPGSAGERWIGTCSWSSGGKEKPPRRRAGGRSARQGRRCPRRVPRSSRVSAGLRKGGKGFRGRRREVSLYPVPPGGE